ncbi:tetratricopeptide repeat protein [Amycolatopsis sp. NPDC026612]|uniref:tetratricopeptide repeat protein n=1 Tax=Amycolatopsis sp. NPDC026612 TaxID=3155466 RepID=UPI00340D6ECB
MNAARAEVCAGCDTPLSNHARLAAYPAYLFNRGLAEARAGRLARARDLFAAVVHWCPLDVEARNALALANFELGDTEEARRHWNEVVTKQPDNPFATQGLERLKAPAP